jgi:hypothetical protein
MPDKGGYMKENLKVWNELKAVPAEAKKKISAGRLKGMTDIKPQWRLQMMTEQFGCIGIGWYYEPIKKWTVECGGEISAHVDLNLYIKDGDKWSAPIFGTGGAMLLSMENVKDYEKSIAIAKYNNEHLKPFHNDEAYKMATTDALSVAMKQLGVAADVYMGLSDSKYDKPVEKAPEVKLASTKQLAKLKDCVVSLQAIDPDKAKRLSIEIGSGKMDAETADSRYKRVCEIVGKEV